MSKNNLSKIKEELEELEKKKTTALEGKKGFFPRLFTSVGYNAEINRRRNILKADVQTLEARKQIELEKARTELAQMRSKRIEFNKKSQIKFEDLL